MPALWIFSVYTVNLKVYKGKLEVSHEAKSSLLILLLKPLEIYGFSVRFFQMFYIT